MNESPRFLQGVYEFDGHGLESPVPLHPDLTYTVPANKSARPVYCRSGNSSGELIYLILARNGHPMRYCPIGAKAGIDVGFHISENIGSSEVLQVLIAAPSGVKGQIVVDLGLVEN